MRERGHVGRRIWRRRKKRSGPAAAVGEPQPTSADAGGEIDVDIDDGDDGALAAATPVEKGAPEKKRGLFATIKGALKGGGGEKKKKAPKPPPPEPSYLVVDPTRDVLAVPRGAARLDAFEKAIKTAPVGTPQFRALALAFHKELQALAESAGVDLSLFDTRVEACAQALIAAGEEERAGTLFLRVGRRHQAAELFVAAGAIDALEEAHAQIHWEEGGPKHEARMAFERFEALFLVGLREQAFGMLERAHKLWGDNPIYSEIHAEFGERLGKPGRLALTSGRTEIIVVARWPVVIGRGEDAGVRLTSPLISRAHLKIERDAATSDIVVVDLESRGGTRIGGEILRGTQRLPPGADIDMAGVVVKTEASASGLWLHAVLAPERRTVAALTDKIAVANDVVVRFDARGRAVVEPPAVVNGEHLRKPLLLLHGDRVGSFTVSRG